MEQWQTQRIRTISEFHALRGLPKPRHPLISVVDYSSIKQTADIGEINWILDFYMISLKKGMIGLNLTRLYFDLIIYNSFGP
jgi:AraC family transcriptional activator of pobA